MRTTLVTDYLELTATKYPDKIAFSDEKNSFTFSELRETARHIATGLVERKFFKRPVAVFLEKSPMCIAAFMGVAYSGNFYTPLDTGMPKVRIEKIMSTLSPAVVLTDTEHERVARDFAGLVEIVNVDTLKDISIDNVALDAVTANIIDTDVLYVLFTSGSTGDPKGVIIPHKGVVDYTEWVTKTFKIDERHIFGNQAPFYFDNSVLDIYQTLKTGATTYIIPSELFAFPVRLLNYLYKKKINIIFWVPSALCLVANLKALNSCNLSFLKKILFCGEVMPTKQLNMWREVVTDALFANLYGPTEITDVCTYYVINRFFSPDESLPIGKPCQNTDILVLNEQGQTVNLGETGELCVRGTGLAYGYYNNPEKTEAAFVQNPLNTSYPEVIYRTGDLVKYNKFGELEYIGRKDFQIKHMGHRIELGEIEAAVSALEGIERCCCLYDTKRSKIVLFYTGEVDPRYLVDQLHNLIPEYMIPNRKVRLEKMPINLNGKIDRVALKEML